MSDTKPGWLSFSIRDLLWLTALVAVVLWSKYGSNEKPGRYLLYHDPAYAETHFLDTATGACWIRTNDSSRTWTPTTSPIAQKK
jgi:hypothetical protein